MQVQKKVVIKGAGYFEGEVEGKHYKTGQVFIEEAFDPSNERYKGFRTVEYKCLETATVTPIMHLPFPITCEVDFEISATKRGSVVVVTKVVPIELARPMPKAA